MWLFLVILIGITLALNVLLFIWAARDGEKGDMLWRGFMIVIFSYILYVYASDPGIFS